MAATIARPSIPTASSSPISSASIPGERVFPRSVPYSTVAPAARNFFKFSTASRDPPNAPSVLITARPDHAANVASRSGSTGVCASTSTPASAASFACLLEQRVRRDLEPARVRPLDDRPQHPRLERPRLRHRHFDIFRPRVRQRIDRPPRRLRPVDFEPVPVRAPVLRRVPAARRDHRPAAPHTAIPAASPAARAPRSAPRDRPPPPPRPPARAARPASSSNGHGCRYRRAPPTAPPPPPRWPHSPSPRSPRSSRRAPQRPPADPDHRRPADHEVPRRLLRLRLHLHDLRLRRLLRRGAPRRAPERQHDPRHDRPHHPPAPLGHAPSTLSRSATSCARAGTSRYAP